MAVIDKDKALMDWMSENAEASGAVLFGFLTEANGDIALISMPEESAEPYMDGSKLRRYLFCLRIRRELSDTTDTVNTDGMMTLRQWQAWIDAQQDAGNYPDFGPNCSCYELQCLADNPQYAGQLDEGNAVVFQFPAQITYLEEK